MIKFKHIKNSDIVHITPYLTDLKVSKYLSWKPYRSKSDIKKYFDYSIFCISYPDEIFSIQYNRIIIGTVHILSRNHNITQIGFGILPKYWNQGLGSIILKKIIKYIKKSNWINQTKEIRGVINKDNIYAIKIFQKQNFNLSTKYIKNKFDVYTVNL